MTGHHSSSKSKDSADTIPNSVLLNAASYDTSHTVASSKEAGGPGRQKLSAQESHSSSKSKDSADTISNSVLLNAPSFDTSHTVASSKEPGGPDRQKLSAQNNHESHSSSKSKDSADTISAQNSHESPIKKDEILLSSQSPIPSRSVRRKLKRKRSIVDKKLSDNFDEQFSNNFVESINNVVHSSIVKTSTHVADLNKEASYDFNRDVLETVENENVDRNRAENKNDDKASSEWSQSLLKPFSASARATQLSMTLEENQKDDIIESEVEGMYRRFLIRSCVYDILVVLNK